MSVDEIKAVVEQALKGVGLATKEVLTFEEAALFTGLSALGSSNSLVTGCISIAI